MYPRLSDLFRDLFGFELPLPIYSFGAMVALAVFVAAWLTGKELDRMYRAGRLGAVRVPVRDKGKSGRRGATTKASPSVLIGTVTVIAVVGGFAGAKLFHILENLGSFGRDPLGMIFSTGGFTFYGGLIVAALAIARYVRSKGLGVGDFADAVAPTLMLGYGIGRIGCYLAGDGDWGVCSDLADKPGWIPAWLWSEDFSRSILGAPAPVLEGCPPGMEGVYPTMLYEFAMASALFAVLWALRKHPYTGGWLFALYLVFNGAERFLIEQIRVNVVMFELGGWPVTQAMIIAVFLMGLGAAGLAMTWRRRSGDEASVASSTTPTA